MVIPFAVKDHNACKKVQQLFHKIACRGSDAICVSKEVDIQGQYQILSLSGTDEQDQRAFQFFDAFRNQWDEDIKCHKDGDRSQQPQGGIIVINF